jgi:hypothetical protein
MTVANQNDIRNVEKNLNSGNACHCLQSETWRLKYIRLMLYLDLYDVKFR